MFKVEIERDGYRETRIVPQYAVSRIVIDVLDGFTTADKCLDLTRNYMTAEFKKMHGDDAYKIAISMAIEQRRKDLCALREQRLAEGSMIYTGSAIDSLYVGPV